MKWSRLSGCGAYLDESALIAACFFKDNSALREKEMSNRVDYFNWQM